MPATPRPTDAPTSMQIFAEEEPQNNAAPKGNLYPKLQEDPYTIEDARRLMTPEPDVVHEINPDGYQAVPSDNESQPANKPIHRPIHPERVNPMDPLKTYLLAPFNLRTYALMLYFTVWNLPLAIFECFWVNLTFWMSFGFIPLCAVGLGFMVIFSWTWRALMALEVGMINIVNPPRRGPIERAPLAFSPHLTNMLTWIAVPYLSFFKICWAGFACGIVSGFYFISLMFILGPAFYGMGIGWPCPSCNGVWIIFVNPVIGLLLFYIGCVLTLLLGTAERELIRALGQATGRTSELTAPKGYNEVSKLLGGEDDGVYAKGVNKSGGGWYVVPDANIYQVARKGTNGSRVCIGLGAASCCAFTIFFLVVIISSIAAAHCSGGWGDSSFIKTDIGDFEIDVNPYSTVGVNASDWTSHGASGGMFSWFNEGEINVKAVNRKSQRIGVTVYHQSRDKTGGNISGGITTELRDGIVYVSNTKESYTHRIRHCSSYYIEVNVPQTPLWDAGQGVKFLVQGTSGVALKYRLIHSISAFFSTITLLTKDAEIYLQTRYPTGPPPDASLTMWNISTSNDHIQVQSLYSKGTVNMLTSNDHITVDYLQVGPGSQVKTSNDDITLNEVLMDTEGESTLDVTTTNGRIYGTATFDKTVVHQNQTSNKKQLSLVASSEVHFETKGFYGDFSLSTSQTGSWDGINIDDNCQNTCDYYYTEQAEWHKEGKILPPSSTPTNWGGINSFTVHSTTDVEWDMNENV